MPQIHDRKPNGADFQPYSGNRFASPSQPPDKRTDYENLVKDLEWYASQKWVQFHAAVAYGMESERKV